jgi:hypothetical protein
MSGRLSQSEWLLVRDALELLNRDWDDESVLSLGLVKILKHLIDAGTISIGCTVLTTAIHRVILIDGSLESCWEVQTALERRMARVIETLANSEQSGVDEPSRNGNPYSDLAKPLPLNAALGVIIPVWSCSTLVDILVVPGQREQFSDSRREMLNLLITHIGEAFRRVWIRQSFSPEARMR